MIGENMKEEKNNCKKNGFTLVEALAVIIVLGILSITFIPNALKVLKDNSNKIYKIKEKELLNAAEDYVKYDKSFSFPNEVEVKYVTMLQLIKGNYLDKILDNKTANECVAFVKVTRNDIYGYNYDACLICDKYKTNKDFCDIALYNSL